MKHYYRWKRNGDPLRLVGRNVSGIVGDDEARFWFFVDRREPDKCWSWTGPVTHNGYGWFGSGKRHIRAHRYAYELLIGPIPKGYEVDHVWRRGCRSRACVNPEHLEAVSKAENSQRQTHREHCHRGHLWAENAYVRPDGRGRQCAACQRERESERPYRPYKRRPSPRTL